METLAGNDVVCATVGDHITLRGGDDRADTVSGGDANNVLAEFESVAAND